MVALKKQKTYNPDNELIRQQIEEWDSKFSENNTRGKEMIDFISCGKQWAQGVAELRRNQGKESLTLNICKKELKKFLSQSAEIEYSIDVHPTTAQSQDDMEESNTFSLLMNNIALCKKIREGMAETLNKSAQFGYAFGEINFAKIDNDDMCLYPVYLLHKDPRLAFFDLNAYTKTKTDGKFCGIKRMLSREEVRKKIPGISEKKCLVMYEDNKVIDYWYRCEEEAEFILLLSGKYKREDLLTFDDKNNKMTRQRLSVLKKSGSIDEDFELTKEGKTDRIYFKRVCNWIDTAKPVEFPTCDLPLLYHAAFTHWTPDHSNYAIPFGYELKGAQKLLNFVNSQIATQAKNSSSDKWLMKPEHVPTQEQIDMATEINQREGGMVFGGDTSTIRREKSSEVSMSLIQMSQALKQILDEINGATINADNAQQTVISGEALDKITKNMRLMNDDALGIHSDYVNEVGRIIGQMVPNIITEEREIVVKNMDGTAEALIVNQDVGTGKLKNNIKDMRNKFDYIVKASSNQAMEKEYTMKVLNSAYQINPQLLNDTADIYFRNADCKDSAELSRRASAKIDPDLIKWSQGKISLQQFQQAQQQKSQQQAQQQKEAAENDPTYKAAQAAAAAEHRKADAYQKDSDTKRIATLAKSINDEQKNEITLANTLLKADQGDAKHAIDSLKSSMDLNDHMIDRMREVIGDNDMALQGQTEPGAPNSAGGENPNNPNPMPDNPASDMAQEQ